MRDLLYGYELKNGLLRIKKAEAKYIRYMFNEYLQGKSLCNIAKYLNENKIPVRKQGGKWTHSMIGRILSNLRYSGDMGYPNIVTRRCQIKAIEMCNGRKVNVAKKNAGVRNKASPFYKMVRCGNCGAITRLYEQKGIYYRKCPNDRDKDCILESELQEMVLDMINKLIENSDLIISLDNVISNMLEITKIDNQLSSKLRDCSAAYRDVDVLLKEKYNKIYNQYAHDHVADSMQLKVRLSMMDMQHELTYTLLRLIVKRIILDTEGTVKVILLNNQEIEYPVVYRERRLLCQE